MFNKYLDKVIQNDQIEQIEDETYFGWIISFKGVCLTKQQNKHAAKHCARCWTAGYSSTLLIALPYLQSMG